MNEDSDSKPREKAAQLPFWRTFVRPPSPVLSPAHLDAYQCQVQAHLCHGHASAAAPKTNARAIQPASAAQAAWRFYGNPDITLQQVFSPILGEARTVIPQACQEFALVACDWCNLHYKDHHGKKGRIVLANSKDLGYEMFSGLAMDDRDGRPIAPLWIELCDQAGIHSTRD
ncbi:MAG: hypothetical protein AAF802_31680, partial [Planctomycetota bacterium]